MKKIVAMLLLFAGLLIMQGCIGAEQAEKADELKKLKVVASFYPMQDFAENIGKSKAEISVIIPNGVEPHDFEPKPSDIKKISEADVFIYNGAGMEPWAENILEGVEKNENLIIVEASEGIELLEGEGHEHHHGHEGDEDDVEHESHDETLEHGAGQHDPHVWLDPVLAKKQVVSIKNAFARADPENKGFYESNALEYMERLDALDAKIRKTMSACRKKDILITHATLGYFCKEYDCNQIAITGIMHEDEPSAQDLMEIIEHAREENIRHVFFESLINPKSAETIAMEINGKVLVFNSIHGLTEEERKNKEDYISLMEKNLENIKIALECN